MTMLRQVLDHFEHQSGAISLPAMARELKVEPPMLQEMIDFWVRKGRLREVTSPVCANCSGAGGCPFVFTLPRSYELNRGESDTIPPPEACPHCGCH